MPDLSGLSALIFRASADVGRATALKLGADGTKITAFAQNQTHLQTLKKPLPSIKQSVRIKPLADPAEIIKAIIFWGSQDASYTTRISLAIDGGRRPTL